MKTSAPRRKPTVAIIGAGRLGQAFGLALQSSGYSIVALVGRHRAKVEKAAALFGAGKPCVLSRNELVKLPDADLILIATPDDVIAAMAEKLSDLPRGDGRGTVLHTSGALSSEALAPLADKGLQTGSIHPLISVSDPVSGAAALHAAFFCIEGTRKATLLAKKIVHDLGGSSFAIKPENKALYHAAAVMASPHLTALFDIATEMLAACGLSKRKAQEVFMPLLESTVKNLQRATPQQALTGTFARGDVATVRKHLQSLSSKEFAQALAVYKLLGLHSLELAEKNGLDPKILRQIKTLLRRGKA